MVQITIVSMNTSTMPSMPCFTGSFVSAAACAMGRGADARLIGKYAPCHTAFKGNDYAQADASAQHRPEPRKRTLYNQSKRRAQPIEISPDNIEARTTTYTMLINGTIIPATSLIRFTPPKRTTPTSPATTRPDIRRTENTLIDIFGKNETAALSTAPAIALICVIVELHSVVTAPKMANTTASHLKETPHAAFNVKHGAADPHAVRSPPPIF